MRTGAAMPTIDETAAGGHLAQFRAIMGGRLDLSREILEGRISSTILKISLPVIISSIFQVLYNLVDAYFVGGLGPDAIAAITLGFPFIFLIFAIGIGVSIGVTSVVSRFLGAGMDDVAGERASTGLALALVMTLVMMAVGFLTLEATVKNIGVSAGVKAMAWDYIAILLLGTGFVFVNLTAGGIIRAEGNMIVPMYALICGTVLNIILDPVLIYGLAGLPHLGVRGAALATVVSQVTVMTIVLLYLLLGRTRTRIHLRHMHLRARPVRQILHVGFPATVMQLMIAFGVFLWNVLAAGVSDEAVAALGLGFRLNSIAFVPALGMNVAIVTIVGQNVGAAKFQRVREVVSTGIFMVYVYMAIVAIVLSLRPEFWISLFTSDWEVIRQGGMFLRIVTPTYIFLAITVVMSGAFQGAGDAVPPMVIMSLRMALVAVPLAWVLMSVLGMGSTGLWIGIAVSNVFSATASYLWFIRGTWQRGHHVVRETGVRT